MRKWFVTWDRPEYKEWASKNSTGYELLIIRREPKQYFCVKANLTLGETGLPGFKVLKEKRFKTKQDAMKQISSWQ